MSSWWVEDFDSKLSGEQARMKRELTPRQIEKVFEHQRRIEEKEIRGFSADGSVSPYDALGDAEGVWEGGHAEEV